MEIKVYDCALDAFCFVTQEWCDNAQISMNNLAKVRNIIKAITNLNIIHDKDKIQKIADILKI